MDLNKNGLLSLGEIDIGMRDVIKLPALFKLKKVLMRAYQAAKDKVTDIGNPNSKHFV